MRRQTRIYALGGGIGRRDQDPEMDRHGVSSLGIGPRGSPGGTAAACAPAGRKARVCHTESRPRKAGRHDASIARAPRLARARAGFAFARSRHGAILAPLRLAAHPIFPLKDCTMTKPRLPL